MEQNFWRNMDVITNLQETLLGLKWIPQFIMSSSNYSLSLLICRFIQLWGVRPDSCTKTRFLHLREEFPELTSTQQIFNPCIPVLSSIDWKNPWYNWCGCSQQSFLNWTIQTALQKMFWLICPLGSLLGVVYLSNIGAGLGLVGHTEIHVCSLITVR